MSAVTDRIASNIRKVINDEKTQATNVVKEAVSSSYIVNDDIQGAAGVSRTGESYMTQNMPIVTGASAIFRGGRWQYKVFTGSDEGPDGTRWIKWLESSGTFHLPTGQDSTTFSVPVGASDTVYLSYSWTEELPYELSDTQINEFIRDGTEQISSKHPGWEYTTSGALSSALFNISPSPPQAVEFLIALQSTVLARIRLEQQGYNDGIYVRDGDITIDTTKTLGSQLKSIQALQNTIDQMVADMIIADTRGVRIDNYSTKDLDHYDIGYYQEIWSSD